MFKSRKTLEIMIKEKDLKKVLRILSKAKSGIPDVERIDDDPDNIRYLILTDLHEKKARKVYDKLVSYGSIKIS